MQPYLCLNKQNHAVYLQNFIILFQPSLFCPFSVMTAATLGRDSIFTFFSTSLVASFVTSSEPTSNQRLHFISLETKTSATLYAWKKTTREWQNSLSRSETGLNLDYDECNRILLPTEETRKFPLPLTICLEASRSSEDKEDEEQVEEDDEREGEGEAASPDGEVSFTVSANESVAISVLSIQGWDIISPRVARLERSITRHFRIRSVHSVDKKYQSRFSFSSNKYPFRDIMAFVWVPVPL